MTSSQSSLPRDMTGSEFDKLIRSAMGNEVFSDPNSYGITLTFGERKETPEGKQYFIFKQNYKDRCSHTIYIDPETYLPYKSVSYALSPTKDYREEEEVLLSDYWDVQGVKVPFSFVTYRSRKLYESSFMTEYKCEANVDDSLFEKP